MSDSKIIFYLDDDLEDLYLFKEVAEDLGHAAHIFMDGNRMMKEMETQIPDIIFLDICMPVFHGEEIIHLIKRLEKLKDIPVVMISGYSPKSLVRQYLEAGAVYVMKKPATINDFTTSLEYVLSIDWAKFQAFS